MQIYGLNPTGNLTNFLISLFDLFSFLIRTVCFFFFFCVCDKCWHWFCECVFHISWSESVETFCIDIFFNFLEVYMYVLFSWLKSWEVINIQNEITTFQFDWPSLNYKTKRGFIVVEPVLCLWSRVVFQNQPIFCSFRTFFLLSSWGRWSSELSRANNWFLVCGC